MKTLLTLLLLLVMTSCYVPKYYSVQTKDNPSVRVMKTKKEIKQDIHIIKKELKNERRRKNENG